jgi:putative hydrolase of the HAD superfamily
MPAQLTIRAVLFDLYRTLIDIWTDEKDPWVWEEISRFLNYQDLWLEPQELSARFFAGAVRQQQELAQEFAEVDITLVFQDILVEAGSSCADSLSLAVASMFRVLSTKRFQLFPDVVPALERLRGRFKLGIVSDAQRAFFRTELAAARLAPLVDVAVGSGEHGFHKPDPRLFRIALERLEVLPEQAMYVGDSVHRDMCGAHAAGVRPVLLDRFGDQGPGLSACRPHRIVRDLDEFCGWLFSEA